MSKFFPNLWVWPSGLCPFAPPNPWPTMAPLRCPQKLILNRQHPEIHLPQSFKLVSANGQHKYKLRVREGKELGDVFPALLGLGWYGLVVSL